MAQIAWSVECLTPADAERHNVTYVTSQAWLVGCGSAAGRTSLLVILFCAGLIAPMLSSVPYAAGSSVPPKLIGCPRFSVTRTYWRATHTRFSILQCNGVANNHNNKLQQTSGEACYTGLVVMHGAFPVSQEKKAIKRNHASECPAPTLQWCRCFLFITHALPELKKPSYLLRLACGLRNCL